MRGYPKKEIPKSLKARLTRSELCGLHINFLFLANIMSVVQLPMVAVVPVGKDMDTHSLSTQVSYFLSIKYNPQLENK